MDKNPAQSGFSVKCDQPAHCIAQQPGYPPHGDVMSYRYVYEKIQCDRTIYQKG